MDIQVFFVTTAVLLAAAQCQLRYYLGPPKSILTKQF